MFFTESKRKEVAVVKSFLVELTHAENRRFLLKVRHTGFDGMWQTLPRIHGSQLVTSNSNLDFRVVRTGLGAAHVRPHRDRFVVRTLT